MFRLFFDAQPPNNYRAWKTSDYSFYDQMAYYLLDLGVIGLSPADTAAWTALRTQLLSFAQVLTPFKQIDPAAFGQRGGQRLPAPCQVRVWGPVAGQG